MRQNFVLNVLSACVLVSSMAAPGCIKSYVTTQKQFPTHRIDSLIRLGESTKNHVRSSLGEPSYVTLTDTKREIWTYYYTITGLVQSWHGGPVWEALDEKTCHKGFYVTYHTLTITFDKTGTVEKMLRGKGGKDEPVI